MATITTASQFRAAMRRRMIAVRKAGAEGLADAAGVIADEVKDLCPTDTGELAGTIHATPVVADGDRLSASVEVGGGLDSPHVASEEYGNSRQVAKPFIRPAFRLARPRARAAILRKLSRST